ncbi:hypothetical protein JXA12_00785 [Candidatus Woesearchaeota archaeon]|nr:hypothetical protein [Candidatus Woesearchaeota archaeon]
MDAQFKSCWLSLWPKGVREIERAFVYHLSSVDGLVLADDLFFQDLYNGCVRGLPAYIKRPSRNVIPDERPHLYLIEITDATALRVGALLQSTDEEFYTTYDLEFEAHASRWGFHGVAALEGLEKTIERLERANKRTVDVVLYSEYLAVLRSPGVVNRYKQMR